MLARALAGLVNDSLGALEPALVARVTIGEDLVDDAALIPCGARLAVLVDGDLEGGDVRSAHVRHGLAAGRALARAHVELRAVSAGHAEAIPQDAGLGTRDVRDKRVVLAEGHGDELLAAFIYPRTDLADQKARVGVLDAQGEMDGGSGHDGAEGHAVFRPAGVMDQFHSASQMVVGAINAHYTGCSWKSGPRAVALGPLVCARAQSQDLAITCAYPCASPWGRP